MLTTSPHFFHNTDFFRCCWIFRHPKNAKNIINSNVKRQLYWKCLITHDLNFDKIKLNSIKLNALVNVKCEMPCELSPFYFKIITSNICILNYLQNVFFSLFAIFCFLLNSLYISFFSHDIVYLLACYNLFSFKFTDIWYSKKVAHEIYALIYNFMFIIKIY